MKLKSLLHMFRSSKDQNVGTDEVSGNTSRSDAKALVASGIAKSQKGDFLGAIRDFDYAIKCDANSMEAYFERGKAKRELKDESAATQDFDKAQRLLNRLDEGLQAYDAAKEAYYDASDYKTAVRLFNRTISLIPSLTEIYCHRGCAKQFLGDDKGAIEDFSKSIEVDACNKADAYHQRGKIKRNKLDDAAGALDDFNEAVKLCPTDPDMLYSRATVLEAYDALQDLNRAIELNPADAKLYAARTLKRYAEEDLNGAIEDLTHFIELKPTDTALSLAEAYALRAAFKATGLHDEDAALVDYNKSIELDASRPRTYIDRGMTRHGLRDYEGAILDFTQAIALNASEGEAYHWRGLAKRELGLDAECGADLAKAKQLGFTQE